MASRERTASNDRPGDGAKAHPPALRGATAPHPCLTVPFAAVACFALVVFGASLSFQAASDVDKALSKIGEGASQVRLATQYCPFFLGATLLVNWFALLQTFLASGRTLEILFSKRVVPKDEAKKAAPSRAQCLMMWYCVRPVQAILFLCFAMQLLLCCIFLIAGWMVMMMSAVCKARATHELTLLLTALSSKDVNTAWNWASRLNADLYCSTIAENDSACALLILSGLLTVLGQGPMMACLSWSRERVRSQQLVQEEPVVDLFTQGEVDKQVRLHLERQAQTHESQTQEIVVKERRKSQELQRSTTKRIDDLTQDLKDKHYMLREMKDAHADEIAARDGADKVASSEEEQTSRSQELEGSEDEDQDYAYIDPLLSPGDEMFDQNHPMEIPPGRGIPFSIDDKSFDCFDGACCAR